MGRLAKIPQALIPEILERAAQEQKPSQIRAWLELEHGVKVSYHAVSQRLRALRRMRKDITKAAVEEKVRGTVAKDVDHIQTLIDEAKKVFDNSDDDEIKLKAIETRRRLLEMRFNLNGLNEPDRDWGEKPKGSTPAVNVNIGTNGPVVLLPPEDPT